MRRYSLLPPHLGLSQELKDNRVVTMEVEARNLDKKVCMEGGPGVQELSRQGWCIGGGRGQRSFILFVSACLITGVSVTLTGLPGKIDPVSGVFSRQGDGNGTGIQIRGGSPLGLVVMEQERISWGFVTTKIWSTGRSLLMSGKDGSSPHKPSATGSFVLYPQVIKNNLNPTWKRLSVPLQHFCGETSVHPSRWEELAS